MMTQEEWRPVVGYEGYYEVSNCGNVRSLPREVTRSNGSPYTVSGRLKKLSVGRDEDGCRLTVMLCKDGVEKRFKVHRLVALAFVDGCEDGLTVDHINGNHFDNRACNLRWCTHEENVRFAVELGLNDSAFAGVRRYAQSDENRRRTRERSRKPVIRNDGQIYESARDASNALGVSASTISKHIREGYLSCKGYSFRYLTEEEREKFGV